jgi:HTH-type transcriptional regulator, sugar sensing transcriptional regulator
MKFTIIDLLKFWNMSEYEAKIYVTLVKLRKGSARDIHELTGIPRGRVYENLNLLVQKGLIDILNTNPCQYRALDIRPTFERLKKEYVLSLDNIIEELEDIEKNTSSNDLPCFKLKNEWAIEQQIAGLLRRIKKQILILCNDPVWYSKFKEIFRETNKKINFYLIVEDPLLFSNAGVRLYTCDNLIRAEILGLGKKEGSSKDLLCVIFADEYEKMMIFRENGSETGLCSSSFLLTTFISQSILERIKPVNMKLLNI